MKHLWSVIMSPHDAEQYRQQIGNEVVEMTSDGDWVVVTGTYNLVPDPVVDLEADRECAHQRIISPEIAAYLETVL